MKKNNNRTGAWPAMRRGIHKGWDGFVWMLKILLPISFVTLLIDYFGLIHQLEFALAPAMQVLSLPTMAALPIVAGVITGVYGGIAAMAALPLSVEQMTLVTVFILISHNLIQEGIIQAKSGIHPLKACLVRLAASVVAVWFVALWLQPETPSAAVTPELVRTTSGLGQALYDWGLSMLWLNLEIFGIIMTLMMLLELLKQYQLIHPLVGSLSPLLRLMRLDRRVGMLWLTAVMFGLAYGAAVIVEEAKQGGFTRQELERLHISVGINHSIIEDPVIFMPLGIHALWLWLPRLLAAIAAVLVYDLWTKMVKS